MSWLVLSKLMGFGCCSKLVLGMEEHNAQGYGTSLADQCLPLCALLTQ